MLLGQLSYAIKNQLVAPKAHSRSNIMILDNECSYSKQTPDRSEVEYFWHFFSDTVEFKSVYLEATFHREKFTLMF